MEFDNLVTLIKILSDSSITRFEYEQDGVKLHLEKEAIQTMIQGTEVRPVKVESNVAVSEVEPIGNIITSPLVGRFYVAPAEDADPFVAVGDTVKKGQTVAIVEAMKLMNDIESDYDGTIVEVLVENGDAVEYGQPLFRIK